MSKTTKETASPAESPAPAESKSEVTVHLKVTVNGAIIGEAHHAAGKVLSLPKTKADAVVALGQGEIIGVA